MTLILSGSDGLSDVDGSAATPAIRGTDANTGIFFGTDIIGFSEGGVEAMRIDASGNVGLNVTPNAWGSTYKAFQAGTTNVVAGIASQTDNFVLHNFVNAYFDGTNWKYIASQEAGRYELTRNVHKWFNAPSGTAGNTITFTQALTLNANGALALQGASTSATGVGITFPATQSASSDANTLDDYEEGTWTPSVSVSGFTQSVSSTSGIYTKIGNVVTVRMAVNLSSSGRPTSYSEITGIPFTPSTTSVGVFAGGNPGAGIQGGSMYASSGGSLFWYATNGTTDSNSWSCTVTYFV